MPHAQEPFPLQSSPGVAQSSLPMGDAAQFGDRPSVQMGHLVAPLLLLELDAEVELELALELDDAAPPEPPSPPLPENPPDEPDEDSEETWSSGAQAGTMRAIDKTMMLVRMKCLNITARYAGAR